MIGGAALAAIASTPAQAADAAPAAAPAAAAPPASQELVVTGSRIPQPNLTSVSPVTVVTSQEAKYQGTTNVETLINNLPAAFADMTGAASNGATGTANVNLRGLGSSRTLVLVDGKRLMPSDPAAPVADLNQVPAALVDHVEVVTGGASAVYGSDALAGVVNFIMKRNFEGVRLDAQFGFAQHDNGNPDAQHALALKGLTPPPGSITGGHTWDITAVIGVNSADGRGNATVYAGYRHIEGVTQDRYDFTACSISTVGAGNDQHVCQGSSNYNRFVSLDNGKNLFPLPNRTFRPYNGSTDFFNFAPFNYLMRPDERYVLGGFAHYEIDPKLDVYVDAMFSDDHTLSQVAPSGLFLGSGTVDGAINVNCDNPLMSAQQAGLLGCGTILGPTADATLLGGRRDIEGGPRINDLRHSAYRIDIGAKGDLGKGWNYDIYGLYGITVFNENFKNELSKQRVQNALEVVTDPSTGQPVCKVTLSGQDPACVPLDIFGGLGAWTPAMLNYVLGQGFQSGFTEEDVISAQLTGDIGQYGFKLPWANEGVGVAIGGEYRREALKLETSRDFQLNDLYGQGGATLPVPLSAFHVKELFGEIRVPIAQDMPYARLLSIDAGYRYSDYSSVGSTNAWKIGGDWQPVADIRLRGSYQRAVRAPNVLESFSPNNNVLFGFQDPCSGATPVDTFTQCARTGVTQAQYGHIVDCPSAQCKNIVGGNAALKPETSSTWSVGAVLTPTFLHGFSGSIDYFDIDVKDLINSYGGAFLFTTCANTGDPSICALVKRDPNGLLFTSATRILNITQNTGFLKTKGIDFAANYRFNLADVHLGEHGSVSVNFVGTWLQSLVRQPVPPSVPGGGGTYDCAGLYGTTCGTPAPKWRHTLRVTWNTPWKASLSANWRYMSSAGLDFLSSNPILQTAGAGAVDPIDAKLPATGYLDLAATWTVRDGVTLRLGVNNVMDRDPPIVDTNVFGISSPPFGNGNTYPNVYDSLGRTFFFGITADF
jgi:outer membrane receptor protein involved in Fe transport